MRQIPVSGFLYNRVSGRTRCWGILILQIPGSCRSCAGIPVDTQLALELALDKKSSEIHILGGTGTRLDHMLGTVRLPGLAMERGVPCYLVDAHNRIRLIRERTVLKKSEQYGDYVSLIPLTTQVSEVTLTGFKYPLRNYTLGGFESLGISNEIVEEEAVVDFKDGILILAESRD